jgi:hypothetical protein
MIPWNISRQHILAAMREIDTTGVPPGRESTKFTLVHNGKPYPPKYVISLANKFANREELKSSLFNGGAGTNDFLRRLGFTIIERPAGLAVAETPQDRKQYREKTERQHDERCRECKLNIERLLGKLYGRVEKIINFT